MSDRTTMRISWAASMLRSLGGTRKLNELALKLALRLEGGDFYSLTAREIMLKRYGVEIGDYSYGDCFVPGYFPKGVKIGRYVSVGPEVRVFMRNHPMDRLSLHPFFFNKTLGFVPEDNIKGSILQISHDAWLGARSLILPGCTRIGLGAIVGAGSVVTKNVPDFAVVAGNPARILRMRFPENLCSLIRESNWWEHSASDCISVMASMVVSLDNSFTHPLLAKKG